MDTKLIAEALEEAIVAARTVRAGGAAEFDAYVIDKLEAALTEVGRGGGLAGPEGLYIVRAQYPDGRIDYEGGYHSHTTPKLYMLGHAKNAANKHNAPQQVWARDAFGRPEWQTGPLPETLYEVRPAHITLGDAVDLTAKKKRR